MIVLPAIDLRDGKVVRLQEGDYARQTQYHADPAAVATAMVHAGAAWIHVVDLDAALTGKATNVAAFRAIRQAVGPQVKLELGGGARSEQAVRTMIENGADRVVVGSAALKDWAWFESLVHQRDLTGKIALGLDARNGLLAVHGWTQQSQLSAADVAAKVRGWPLGAIVYTDISRDGMLTGVNIPATAEVIAASGQNVIASGGVSTLDDVSACLGIGCHGVIVGKAYYEGRVDLARAFALAGNQKT
jgi:phosphoribosylformimino-5-aminoimidazole carboxamide ribotide isomerase